MPTVKLTDRFIKAIAPPATDRVDYFDSLLPGLALRVSYKSQKSWCVYYRSPIEVNPKGEPKPKRFTMGKYPKIGLGEARGKAREIFEKIENGEDPQRDKISARNAPRALKGDPVTIRDGAIRYIDEHIHVRNKYQPRADGTRFWKREHIFNRYVIPELGDIKIADLTRKHVRAMQRALEETSGATSADRAAEALRACLNWLSEEELSEYVPNIRLKKRSTSTGRHRTLSMAEIKAIWSALGEMNANYSSIIKLLLLTGQRRTEIGSLTWDEVDLEKTEIEFPPSRTKNGYPHVVPLSPTCVELLRTQEKREDCALVFTSTGRSPFSGYSKSKVQLDEASGVTNWVINDLRRTFSTELNNLGVLPHIVEACINHVTGEAKSGVAGVYNKAHYLPERTQAMLRWSDHIAGVVSGEQGAKVLPIRS